MATLGRRVPLQPGDPEPEFTSPSVAAELHRAMEMTFWHPRGNPDDVRSVTGGGGSVAAVTP